MDDYTSKPVQIENLQSALKRASEAVGKNSPQSSKNTSIDYSVLAELRGVDKEGSDVFVSLITTYLNESQHLLSELRKAIELADTKVVLQLAHRLKGSSATLGAIKLSTLSLSLEKQARTGTINNVNDILLQLEAEFENVRKVFEDQISSVGK
ncbi:MAG: Hpt domain-containing protein [Acidobacteriota bacterium]